VMGVRIVIGFTLCIIGFVLGGTLCDRFVLGGKLTVILWAFRVHLQKPMVATDDSNCRL